MPDAIGYDEEFDSDDEEQGKVSPERRKQVEALSSLARKSEELVNQSIRDRNTTGFVRDVQRAYQLYNATVVTGQELMEDFEGNRTQLKDGSKVINNLIRQVTNDGASQLGDMLFPNDDDNYGLDPVFPSKPPLSLQNEPAMGPKGQPLTDENGEPVTHLQAWEARKVAVQAKTKRMFQKIDGTLDRIKWGNIGRQGLLDGALAGTCVIKGPFVDPKEFRQWRPTESGQWDLLEDTQNRPTFAKVNVLDFLPDMSAECPEEMGYASVRVRSLARDLEALREVPEVYEVDQIDRLLRHKPEEIARNEADSEYERIQVVDKAVIQDKSRYELFETWASFSREEIEAAGITIPAKWSKRNTLVLCVTHCFGITVSAYVAPRQNRLPFGLWWWDRDPLSLFGRGVPVLGESQQLTINAGWRMILDHGGVSAVPMVTMIKDKVESADPNDTSHAIRGGKVWNLKGDMFNLPDGSNGKPFEVHDIPIHLDQFFAIMDRAEEDLYKVTGVTRVDKNEGGQGVDNAPITLGATQIFQNNSSVSRRRQVRDFDDFITKFAVEGLYDWFMDHEDDDDIKVALVVEPKGSSVLMQREVNMQNLLQLYTVTQGGASEGSKGVNMLREIETGMQFPSGRFIETEDETIQRQRIEAENPPVDPEVQLRELELQIEQVKAESASEKNEADIEIKMFTAQFDNQYKQGQLELQAIEGERKHVREMLKLELMDRHEADRAFTTLQSQQAQVMTRMEEIASRRDIAAGQLLQKESEASRHGDSEELSAVARLQEADTHKRELDNKLAGNIEEGV